MTQVGRRGGPPSLGPEGAEHAHAIFPKYFEDSGPDNMKLQTSRIASALLLSLLFAISLHAEKRGQSRATDSEEFFIISSVDMKRGQLVLKRPTEVTELMLMTEKTVYLDERGKPLQFKDLRAGDTVYITAGRNTQGARVALRVRMGRMTVEEMRRRYLTSP